MLALAAPALGLRLGTSDAGNDPARHTTRQAYDLLAQGFGRASTDRCCSPSGFPPTGDDAGAARLTSALRATRPGVASVAPPG